MQFIRLGTQNPLAPARLHAMLGFTDNHKFAWVKFGSPEHKPGTTMHCNRRHKSRCHCNCTGSLQCVDVLASLVFRGAQPHACKFPLRVKEPVHALYAPWCLSGYGIPPLKMKSQVLFSAPAPASWHRQNTKTLAHQVWHNNECEVIKINPEPSTTTAFISQVLIWDVKPCWSMSHEL